MIKYMFVPKGNVGFFEIIQRDILDGIGELSESPAEFAEMRDSVSVILGNDGSARGIMIVPDSSVTGKQIAELICKLLIDETQSFRLDMDYMTGIE